MGTVEHIKNGSDNAASIILYQDAMPLDMTAVTRVVIEVDDADGSVIDSALIAMDWLTTFEKDGQVVYPITFKGNDAGLTVGIYRDCRVRIFDAENLLGLVWPRPMTLVVE